jgi:leader peptidase (prepilin peptidase)/N-methyltransferase
VIGAAAAWFALLVIHLISPGGMGFGDVRLSFLLGLFLGWLSYGHVVTGLFLGFLLGAVVGLLLVAVRLRSRTDHVPFGPFLAAGTALAILVGDPLVRLWLG